MEEMFGGGGDIDSGGGGIGFQAFAPDHRGWRSLVLSNVRFAIDGPGFAGETPPEPTKQA